MKVILIVVGLLFMIGCSNEVVEEEATRTEKTEITDSKGTQDDKVSNHDSPNEAVNKTPNDVPKETSNEPPAATSVPSSNAIKEKASSHLTLNTGTYSYAWSDSLYYGNAKLTNKGSNVYNLHITTSVGMSFHHAEIDFDFTYDESGYKILRKEPEYQQIKLKFTENMVEVDYEEDVFGGAEAKGQFYLKHSAGESNDFLTRLYTAIELAPNDWDERTSVYTYTLEDGRQLFLVRTEQMKDSVALYDPTTKEITYFGKLDENDGDFIIAELYQLFNKEEDFVYEIVRKDEADRLRNITVERRDNGENFKVGDEEFLLTPEEALYIATDTPTSASTPTSTNDESHTGSKAVYKVASADDQQVVIHVLEASVNEEVDMDASTNDWIKVDRKTGKVTNSFYGPENWDKDDLIESIREESTLQYPYR